MNKTSVFKRFTSLLLALAFIPGIFSFASGADTVADVSDSVISVSGEAAVTSEEFYVGNGIYKIYDKNSVAFIGLLNPNTEAFSVPNDCIL